MMNPFSCFRKTNPARFRRGLQHFTILFLLLGGGCATTSPYPTRERMPEGLYVFDAPGIYESGMARVTPVSRGARVELLETFEGTFELHPRGERLLIRNDDMSYPGLRRSFRGEGQLTGDGQAKGEAKIWVSTIGRFSRDHRASEWTLRPATPEEIQRHEERARRQEARRRRAGMEE